MKTQMRTHQGFCRCAPLSRWTESQIMQFDSICFHSIWEALLTGGLHRFLGLNQDMGRYGWQVSLEVFSVFSQKESKTVFVAYERYKDLLRRYQHHGSASWMHVQILYNGLKYQRRHLIDAAAGGSLSNKWGRTIVWRYGKNESYWASKAKATWVARIQEMDETTVLEAKVDTDKEVWSSYVGKVSPSSK